MENSPLVPEGGSESQLYQTKVAAARVEREVSNRPVTREILTLKQLLDKYTFALGYQNAHLLEVLIALMTTGKVCVEFRSYNERLQLQDPAKMLPQHGAMELFNEYLVSIRQEKKIVSGPSSTRRITVQLPKIVSPTASDKPMRAPPLP